MVIITPSLKNKWRLAQEQFSLQPIKVDLSWGIILE
jgi:hypothetical protein